MYVSFERHISLGFRKRIFVAAYTPVYVASQDSRRKTHAASHKGIVGTRLMLSRKLPCAAKLRQIGQFNVHYNPGDSSITTIYHANY